ncbi:hypothetical protein [Patulibacter sp. SYSU D01012]|uniref:hypothetical protein n=1 Tax=Patulibacter sp. SYSU D01012 TaxID=2817381 RepID=UPI001B306779|nr:hypothetical protein [Patulibacter sp. SYSU D01012]
MFCRHGRAEDRCVVCLREKRQKAAAQKKVSGKVTSSRRTTSAHAASRSAASSALGTRRKAASPSGGGVRVKKLSRHAGDGWSHELLPGVHSSQDALDLLRELSRARVRLDRLTADAPGPYATVRALAGGEDADREEAAWLLFQIAYYGVLEGSEPFREIERLCVRWHEDLPPVEALREAAVGPRGAHAHDRGAVTLQAYRDRAAKAGAQLAMLTPAGTDAARRFDAAYRALALPGLGRPARFELLVSLGRFGLADIAPWSLLLDAGRDPVSVAAKRAFLTDDAVLLQRRIGAFAREVGLPIAAFDLGLLNWDMRPSPTAPLGHLQAGVPAEPDPAEVTRAARALGLATGEEPATGEGEATGADEAAGESAAPAGDPA